MILLASQKIEEYFFDYVEDDEYPMTSYPGFLKYLIAIKKFDKSSMKDLRQKFIDDVDLLNFIKTYCEGDLVDKSLLGLTHATMTQFVLKNKHGYESQSNEEAPKPQEIRISIDPRSSNG